MSFLSDVCKSKVAAAGEKEAKDLEARMYWMMQREYLFANNRQQEAQKIDEAFDLFFVGKATEDDVNKVVPKDAADYMSQWEAGLNDYLPGWDNDTCTMKWWEFGCFAHWAASVPVENRQAAIQTMNSVQSPPYTCADSVRDTQVYQSGPFAAHRSHLNVSGVVIGAGLGFLAVGGIAMLLGNRSAQAAVIGSAGLLMGGVIGAKA